MGLAFLSYLWLSGTGNQSWRVIGIMHLYTIHLHPFPFSRHIPVLYFQASFICMQGPFSPLPLFPSSHNLFLIFRASCSIALDWLAGLLLLSLSGQSFQNPPPPHPTSEESALDGTFQQAGHIMRMSALREGGQDCLLSQKAKHLSWESLTGCLRTQTESSKGSRECSCYCDLHLSSIQLSFKEPHLNTQYISSIPASSPMWEIHSQLSNLSPVQSRQLGSGWAGGAHNCREIVFQMNVLSSAAMYPSAALQEEICISFLPNGNSYRMKILFCPFKNIALPRLLEGFLSS